MADGVCQQVVEDSFDLVRREGCGRLAVNVGLEADASSGGLRLEQTNGGFNEAGDARLLQLEAEHAGVDSGELEQVVDEQRQCPHLFAQCRQVVLGLDQAVLDRLEHRLHRGEWRAQVVACPCDQLPSRVEDLLDALGHRVERGRELFDLGGAAVRRACAEVTAGKPLRRVSDAADRVRDRACEHESGDYRCARRTGGDGEDLRVCAHVEHDPAGEQDGGERNADRDEGEAGELEPDGRGGAQCERDDQPDRQARGRDGEGEADHGSKR